MRTLKALISLLCIALAISTTGEASPMKRFNFSIWTDYTDMKFKGLSQEEKTAKLQRLYGDQVNFVKNHGIRRVIVKILNPAEFDFFKTENFDGSRDDNFYYWAVQLSQSSELEVAFDPAPFDIGTQSWSDRFLNFAAELFKTEKPLGNFLNFREKLAWLSFINDMTMPSGNKQALVRGLVIDPKETEEPLFQHILNLLDQYKYNVSETLTPNTLPHFVVHFSL
ncbi:MAG: hypothetical protein KDK76_02005 [Chlamydiia bacterium]|nr:hypothetical protein [Chlamydiia bacterium]